MESHSKIVKMIQARLHTFSPSTITPKCFAVGAMPGIVNVRDLISRTFVTTYRYCGNMA